MHDVVAVAVELESGETRYFVTWGRIQDHLDPAPLEAIVLARSTGFSLGSRPVRARVCLTMQEARAEPYFFEALVDFGQRRVPGGDEIEVIDARMRAGKELYYLGRPA